VYGKKKKGNIVLMQPLNILDLEVYHHDNKDIHRIKEFRLGLALSQIPYSQTRRAQAFLLTEILGRVLRGEGANPHLFHFIEEAVAVLDSDQAGLENFHLWFLFQLTRFLGFQPHDNYSEEMAWFDLTEGCFVSREPAHPHYLSADLSLRIHRMGRLDRKDLPAIAVNVKERRQLLDALVLFFELHQPGIGKIRSLNVLRDLFD
ncbi:MAG: DNA repair protein RecO C-terminal domain-containing protein, partial [Bacteroidales bacterium]|nr:DNA repair protein RecO C-terminal domain-containing protein [Bacteroidales bacterium]